MTTRGPSYQERIDEIEALLVEARTHTGTNYHAHAIVLALEALTRTVLLVAHVIPTE